MVLKLNATFAYQRTVRRCSSRRLSSLASQSSISLHVPGVRAREPSPPLASTSQLPLDRELYYSHLIIRALLASTGVSPAALSKSPDPSPNSPDSGPEEQSDAVSDKEWELRTGRAIDILQQTLPNFFETGLVSSLDLTLGEPSSSPSNKSTWSLPNGTWHTLKDKLTSKSGTAHDGGSKDAPSIYSPRIRLSYTPPTPLPAPFPQTLHIDGLHLYTASSIFVRHTLNALYTDLRVELKRARVGGGKKDSCAEYSTSFLQNIRPGPNKLISREKNVTFGVGVSGVGRVSGAPSEWEVNCTYTFSPLSGLVMNHSVDSIEPAPHQALFEALGKFGLLDGVGGSVGGPRGVGS